MDCVLNIINFGFVLGVWWVSLSSAECGGGWDNKVSRVNVGGPVNVYGGG